MKRFVLLVLILSFPLMAKAPPQSAGSMSAAPELEGMPRLHMSVGAVTFLEGKSDGLAGFRGGVAFTLTRNLPLYFGLDFGGFSTLDASSNLTRHIQFLAAIYVRPQLNRTFAVKFGPSVGPAYIWRSGVSSPETAMAARLRLGLDIQINRAFGLGLEISAGAMTQAEFNGYMESGLNFNFLF